ncbi:MAG: ParA family protein, partial [Desulfamplus sp.]|nr:ParA family protein [Desulfamplus sp.]
NEILHKFASGSFNVMKNRLRDAARASFDYTIIDHPASLGVLPLTAVIASDLTIIPVNTGSNFSLEGVSEALSFIDEARKNFNPGLMPSRLLLSMVKKREIAHQSSLGIIKEKFGRDQIFSTEIPAAAAMENAEMNKQTIFQLKPSAPVAGAFRDVAREIM